MKKFAMNKDQLMGGGASASPWGGGGYGGSSAVGPSTSWKPPSEEESLEQLQKRIDDHDSAIKDSLHRTTAMANQTREVGAATLRDIHMQGEQLKGIAANQQKARARAARSLHAAGGRDVSPPLPPPPSPPSGRGEPADLEQASAGHGVVAGHLCQLGSRWAEE